MSRKGTHLLNDNIAFFEAKTNRKSGLVFGATRHIY